MCTVPAMNINWYGNNACIMNIFHRKLERKTEKKNNLSIKSFTLLYEGKTEVIIPFISVHAKHSQGPKKFNCQLQQLLQSLYADFLNVYVLMGLLVHHKIMMW